MGHAARQSNTNAPHKGLRAWKRIVVTIGEKIGKTHVTYAQGACAELVAMATIGAADMYGLPAAIMLSGTLYWVFRHVF